MAGSGGHLTLTTDQQRWKGGGRVRGRKEGVQYTATFPHREYAPQSSTTSVWYKCDCSHFRVPSCTKRAHSHLQLTRSLKERAISLYNISCTVCSIREGG